jgi:hypothetical protein
LAFVGKRNGDAPIVQTPAQTFELNIDDASKFVAVERIEDNHFVDAIQKFRSEMSAQLVHTRSLSRNHRAAHWRSGAKRGCSS